MSLTDNNHNTDIDYHQANNPLHENADIENNINKIYEYIDKIDQNFDDIKNSLAQSLETIEPKSQLHQQTKSPSVTKHDQYNKKLLRRVCFVGSIGFVPWVVCDFYFAKNHANCKIGSPLLLNYFTMTGIMSLIFITLFYMIYGFGGFTRKSYDQAQSVGFFCYTISFVFGIFGIGSFLDNIKSFATCGQFITKYFLARSIQNICYFFIFFTSFIKWE